jgi:hypothetical protein
LKNSSGNILFIILIAVVLFAALQYAVSQSTRSSGGNADKEKTLIESSSLVQYPPVLRAAIARLQSAYSGQVQDFEFNPPSDFSNITSTRVSIFNTDGGGVPFQDPPVALLDNNYLNPVYAGTMTGKWIYTWDFEVAGAGTSVPSSSNGNDLIALIPWVREDVCFQINRKLGLPTDPFPQVSFGLDIGDILTNSVSMYADHDYTIPSSEYVIGAAGADSSLFGQKDGCMYDGASAGYIYFSVLYGL